MDLARKIICDVRGYHTWGMSYSYSPVYSKHVHPCVVCRHTEACSGDPSCKVCYGEIERQLKREGH